MTQERWGMSRRHFVGAVGVGAGMAALGRAAGDGAGETERMRINVFSKHLQWRDYPGMAETAREVGFDGVDLTVRPKGHVLPERVKDDLPKAVEAVKKAGLRIEMMTTGITDPRDPTTQAILETASTLGIRYYRLGSFRYAQTGSIPEQLKEWRPVFRELAAMNQQYRIHGALQNHCGERNVGAPIWDIPELIKDLDPIWMGCQFDIRHATVEGGMAWPIHFRLIAPYVMTIIAKDFLWKKTEKGWRAVNCPLGEGMVDFPRYFGMVKKARIPGPLSLHYEYPMGGAEHGGQKRSIPPAEVVKAMRRDLARLKAWL